MTMEMIEQLTQEYLNSNDPDTVLRAVLLTVPAFSNHALMVGIDAGATILTKMAHENVKPDKRRLEFLAQLVSKMTNTLVDRAVLRVPPEIKW